MSSERTEIDAGLNVSTPSRPHLHARGSSMLRRWSVAGIIVALLAGLLQLAVAPSALAATGTTTTTVTVRSGPGDSNAFIGTIAASSAVSFHCYVAGESSTGRYGTEDLWDALDSGGYVPDALVYTGSNSAVVPACPSGQFGTGHYPVAWTGGGGVQPRSGTSTSAGADAAVLPDGLVVAVTCETSGQSLTDSKGFVSALWDQLSSGAYIPNVYIDTQVNGPTPGLPVCSTSSSGGTGTGGNGGGGTGDGGGNNGQGGGSNGDVPSTPTTPSQSSPGTSAAPHDDKPSGDIPFPVFPCQGPETAGPPTCPLPKQPAPSATTKLRYAGDLAQMRALINFCLATVFPNCARAGYHYLNATGSPLIVPVAALYSGLPGFQGQFQYWLRQNVSNAKASLQVIPKNGSKVFKWDTAGITQNWTVFNASSLTNDWHWTLGHFSIRMVGDVWIGPTGQSGDRPVQIRYRSFMWDIYNFGGSFANLEALAAHGMAAEFLQTGESGTEIINTTLSALDPNALVAQGT